MIAGSNSFYAEGNRKYYINHFYLLSRRTGILMLSTKEKDTYIAYVSVNFQRGTIAVQNHVKLHGHSNTYYTLQNFGPHGILGVNTCISSRWYYTIFELQNEILKDTCRFNAPYIINGKITKENGIIAFPHTWYATDNIKLYQFLSEKDEPVVHEIKPLSELLDFNFRVSRFI
jgi:hypothetical protein